MTRKEAEELTGLSTKSIRYYEEKGIIKIDRNDENDYREFTDSDIDTLKFIRMLRYANFSVEEIGDMLTNNAVLEKVKEKIKLLKEEQKNMNNQLYLCEFIESDYQKNDLKTFVENYSGVVDLFESKDWKEVKSMSSKYHFKMCIYYTFINFGPIGWLFINIYDKNYSKLYLNGLAVILSVAITTFFWCQYYYKWRKM